MCPCCGFVRHAGVSRRALLGGSLAALALPRLAFAAPNAAGDSVPGDVALQALMAGNARYVANKPTQRDVHEGRAERVNTQRPIAAVLSCADSRVAPELVFDEGPGRLFVVRVAGNVLDDDSAASLEYAVRFLGVRLALVLGHSNCGAVKAAIDVVKNGATLPGHLPGLIKQVTPAVTAAMMGRPEDLLGAAIIENVRETARLIELSKPILAEAADSKQLMVAGGVYDLASGQVRLT